MGNRGQKRIEIIDEMPADKRVCNSLEFRPSTSNSSVQIPGNLTPEVHEGGDMDTSSSTSGSTRSEGDGDRDSAYGSCDSDNNYRDYYRRRSNGDQSKFKKVLSNLSEEVEQSGQLAALVELCELLSFCTDSSMSSFMADSLSPVLVKFARHESNPDIMLLAIRAITYLCDVHPRSSGFLVRHDAVPALCQRLMAIEYLDVAEQCLQALEKISREQPLACLQSGAIMAVLSYIDFFSTSVQRVALSTVVNICKKLPSENPSAFMEAVPILCNLLQYEDRQLVESVTTCLIKIADQVCLSPDMLDELCRHGLLQQAAHLIDLNSRTTLSQPVYVGLIGLLVKLASGSTLAVGTLLELNISSILKDILTTYDLSHGTPSSPMADGRNNQVNEVLRLLNELLPPRKEQDFQPASEKEVLIVNRPNLLQKFGLDVLPVLIQVVNSGANSYICYGCLTVITKLVHFSETDMLSEMLKGVSIASFLAGVFTRKDHHLLMLALQIVDTILRKLSDDFLNSFVKEGVLFAVDALLSPQKCSHVIFPGLASAQLSNDTSHKSASRDVTACLCSAFDSGPSLSTKEAISCKLEKESVQNLAKHIRETYFDTELSNSERGVTDILQKLRTLADALSDLVHISVNGVPSAQHEEECLHALREIVSMLSGKDPVSTFEFVESGIVKSVVNYLSNGQYMDGNKIFDVSLDQQSVTERRFEVLGRLLMSSPEPLLGDLPLLALVRRLQNALASVENFPVILSHGFKLRNSYATVPCGRCTSYPCLKVQFVKGEDETFIGDYVEDIVNVDPFSSLNAIEGYLWPKVIRNKVNREKTKKESLEAESSSSQLASNLSLTDGVRPDFMESDSLSVNEEKPHPLPSTARDTTSLKPLILSSTGLRNVHPESALEKQGSTSKDVSSPETDKHICSYHEGASPKLLFYLGGEKLDHSVTLYQALLHQQIKAEDDVINSSKLWSQVHKITYRKAVREKQTDGDFRHQTQCSSSGKRICRIPFFSDMFITKIANVEKSSPTYGILSLIRSLEGMNRIRFQVMARERIIAFAEGRTNNLNSLNGAVVGMLQNEFVSSKLTEKLEQQMRDPLSVSIGAMPSWCVELMTSSPFLFGFETRCKYFRLAALGEVAVHPNSSSHNGGVQSGRHQNRGSIPRKKFLVHRNKILDSAAQMMERHACQKGILEVEFNEEVGTGLGPTLEFYTLVSQEFQRRGLGMWRGDFMSHGCRKSLVVDDTGILLSPSGLFPRPWLPMLTTSDGLEFSQVMKNFVLLGWIVARALQDGRVLDLPFSSAFYKVIVGKELTVYDIQSFDPGLTKALLEFLAIVERKRYMESVSEEKPTVQLEISFQNTQIEDLCLDFTLPGYPDNVLTSASDSRTVNLLNLEEYVSLVVDATIKSGISRQVEAFRSGFNQVFPIEYLAVFGEEELERLLCGERDIWNANELLDHIKFDHGYTASSPPVVNLLEIIREFDSEQQRAFLQFVTGAPRLPSGGLASLNPKLTIVRKQHCSKSADADLPSVMTCANYLKLPAYSSKEKMKEKLIYAITEGQGAFHLS